MNLYEALVAGFLMGLMGSLHCIGMCGPLALGVVGLQTDPKKKLRTALEYNFGRAVSYTAMGAILGLIGNQVSMAGFQQYLSIGCGLFILLLFILPYISKNKTSILQSWNQKIQNLLNVQFTKKQSPLFHFELGLINAWLPCGLVYLALAAALASGTFIASCTIMFLFGLGTIPLMLSLQLLGNYINLQWRQKLTKAIPVFILLSSSLLILRGMNLGIPLISPVVESTGTCIKHCCKH